MELHSNANLEDFAKEHHLVYGGQIGGLDWHAFHPRLFYNKEIVSKKNKKWGGEIIVDEDIRHISQVEIEGLHDDLKARLDNDARVKNWKRESLNDNSKRN